MLLGVQDSIDSAQDSRDMWAGEAVYALVEDKQIIRGYLRPDENIPIGR